MGFSFLDIELKGDIGSLYITSIRPIRFRVGVLLNGNIYHIKSKDSKSAIPPAPKFSPPTDELLGDKKIKAEEGDLVMMCTLKLVLNFASCAFFSHIRLGSNPTEGVKVRKGGIVNFINAERKKASGSYRNLRSPRYAVFLRPYVNGYQHRILNLVEVRPP